MAGPGGEIYRYTLESDTKNLQELSEIQRWTVIPALKSVPGVVDDTNFGGFTTEYQLDLDPQQLQHYGLGITDVINAINNNNANAGGGRVSRGDQSYVIRGVGLMHNLADIGSIVVTQVERHAGAGARPRAHHAQPSGARGHPRQGQQSGHDRGHRADAEVPESVADPARHPRQGGRAQRQAGRRRACASCPTSTATIWCTPRSARSGSTIAEGIALVFLILIIFLGSPRSAFVVAVSIPLALVSVFSLLNLTHVSANLLSLGAIDFGILVDGAIVVTEAVLRRREAMPDEELSESEVKAATLQVTRPIFFASLIIITAYLPLFSFERAEAKLFTPMAYTMGYALFGALLTAPGAGAGAGLSARSASPAASITTAGSSASRVQYDRVLGSLPRSAAHHLRRGDLRAARGGGPRRDGRPGLPAGPRTRARCGCRCRCRPAWRSNKASDMASELRRAILKYPEVSYVVTQTGRNDDGTDPWTMSHIEAPVGLKPYDTWPAGESKKAFVDRLAAGLARDLPGYSIGISQPIIDGVNDMIGGAHSPLVAKIYGDDLDELRRIGDQIVDVLVHHPGHLQRLDLPGAADPADRDQAGSRKGRALRRQHDRRAERHPDRASARRRSRRSTSGERTYPLTVRFTRGRAQLPGGARQSAR